MAETRPRVFISYSRSDRAQIARLASALEARGCDVWWDARIEGGSEFATRIEENLESSDAVIVAWSASSVVSDWVRDEAGHGRDRKRLVPVTFDGTMPPIGFRQYHVINLTRWRGNAASPQVDEVMRGVESVTGLEVIPMAKLPRTASFRMERRSVLMLGGLGVLAAAGGIAWRQGWLGLGGEENSIAVLPFKNLSGDKDESYFSDGLSEEIRSALSRNPALQVAAPTSVAQFRDKASGPEEIGRSLGVSFLLEGSVRKAGNIARISAELVDARNGFSRWQQSFDRKLDDVFAVQSEIAQVVSEVLSLRVDIPKAGQGGTHNFDGFDAYLRGMALFRLDRDEKSDREAINWLEKAVSLDNKFTVARAAMAYALAVVAGGYAAPQEARTLYQRAQTEARMALAQEPDLPQVQLTMGFTILYGSHKVGDARAFYEKAYALGGGDSRVAQSYALYSSFVGKSQEAIEAAMRVTQLDPLNASTFRMAGLAHYYARKFDAAVPLFRKALSLKADVRNAHGYLGDIYLLQGKLDEAQKEFEAEPQEMIGVTGQAIVRHRKGDHAGAVNLMQPIIDRVGDNSLYQQGQVLAQWGEKRRALDALEKALGSGDAGLLNAKVDPLLEPLHDDPRFSRLLNRLGLA